MPAMCLSLVQTLHFRGLHPLDGQNISLGLCQDSRKKFPQPDIYAAGLLPAKFSVQTLIDFVLSYPISSALIGLGTMEQIDAAINKTISSQESKIPSFSEVLAVLEKEYVPIPCDRCQRCVCPLSKHFIFVVCIHLMDKI